MLAQFPSSVIITTRLNNFIELILLNSPPIMKDFLTMSEISKLEKVSKELSTQGFLAFVDRSDEVGAGRGIARLLG